MLIALAIIAALVVVVIGLVAVGAVTGRLSKEPPQTVLHLEYAVTDVADRLPFEAAAELTYDDVRALLGWYIDYLEEKGVAGKSDHDMESLPSGPIMADDEEATAYVLGRAGEAGMELDDVAVAQVLNAAAEHLVAIGAVGAEVPMPRDPDDDHRP